MIKGTGEDHLCLCDYIIKENATKQKLLVDHCSIDDLVGMEDFLNAHNCRQFAMQHRIRINVEHFTLIPPTVHFH